MNKLHPYHVKFRVSTFIKALTVNITRCVYITDLHQTFAIFYKYCPKTLAKWKAFPLTNVMRVLRHFFRHGDGCW